MHSVTDNFQDVEQASYYQRYRPRYPTSLYTHIIQLLAKPPGGETRHALAIDLGCGSGQTTLPLSDHFEQVIGVDPSQAQIDEAVKDAQDKGVTNITYRVGLAEELEFVGNGSVDLVTVGTALHWFDVERFCAECVRVLKPGGVVVAYSYGLGEFFMLGTEQQNGKECAGIYKWLMDNHADPQLLNVVDKYINFLPTFQKHFSQALRDDESNTIEWKFSLDGMKGFLKSMSIYQKFKQTLQEGQPNPLDECFDRLAASYGGNPPEVAAIFKSEIAVLSGIK